jgi:PAS domain S-box-containing protein
MRIRNTTDKTKILLVEDEIIVAKDIQYRLTNLGYIVQQIVLDGEQAIHSVEKQPPDIILMDIKLKGHMDGIESAMQIKRRFNIPVIYLTAYADKHTLQRAKITEPFGYIIKPVEDIELRTSIELALYRHSIEDKIRESEEKFRMIFENANDVIVYIDAEGRIRDINDKARHVFNYAPEEIKGERFQKLAIFDNKTKTDLLEYFRKALKQNRPLKLIELEARTKKGRKVIVEVSSTLIKAGHKVEGILSVVRDVTERKMVEKALRTEQRRTRELTRRIIRAQEEERLYLASEIHDDFLQNFVAVLHFFQMVDLSKLDPSSKEHGKKLIEFVKSSITRGRQLISEIEPIRQPNIGFLQAIRKTINQKFFNSGIKVELTCPRKMPYMNFFVKINALRIIQEALNNIRKHARATRVHVVISVTKNRLRMKITDNGVGFSLDAISPNENDHFGLLTMRDRARLIGGKITINSKPGKSTTTTGIFPLRDE